MGQSRTRIRALTKMGAGPANTRTEALSLPAGLPAGVRMELHENHLRLIVPHRLIVQEEYDSKAVTLVLELK